MGKKEGDNETLGEAAEFHEQRTKCFKNKPDYLILL